MRNGGVLYETKEDLEREARFREKIEKRFRCKCFKLPIHWELDFIIGRPNGGTGYMGVAWGEVKCRTRFRANSFPSVFLSKRKCSKGIKLSQHTNLPFTLFVRFQDADLWTNIKSFEGWESLYLRAKNHIENPRDGEVVLHVPLNIFNEF